MFAPVAACVLAGACVPVLAAPPPSTSGVPASLVPAVVVPGTLSAVLRDVVATGAPDVAVGVGAAALVVFSPALKDVHAFFDGLHMPQSLRKACGTLVPMNPVVSYAIEICVYRLGVLVQVNDSSQPRGDAAGYGQV